jgi:hypothetical protein
MSLFEKLSEKKSTRVHVTIEAGLKDRIDEINRQLPEDTVFPYQKMLAEYLATIVSKAEKQLEKDAGGTPEEQGRSTTDSNSNSNQV